MWIERRISEKIRLAADQYPVVVLTGARQTGKTSLLRRLFPDYSYVSLEDPLLAEKAENDTAAFLELYKVPLIIDEVQYAPKLFRRLKAIIDQDRHRMGQMILTGSQKFVLMREVSETLAGRCALLELLPLSCQELRDANLLQDTELPTVYRHLIRGYAPELWRNPSADVTLFYTSYLGTYLERDVRQILNIGSLRDFDRFVRACALRAGQMLNKTELAKDVGVTVNTINAWLSVLEASNQICLLEPYFDNKRKQLVKSPKLYFNDPGFLSFMLGLDLESIKKYSGIGNLWENLIFSELKKMLGVSRKPINLWFYNEHRKTEVDFLLETGAMLYPVEAKFGSHLGEESLKNILKFRECYEQCAASWLACRVGPSITRKDVKLVHGLTIADELNKVMALY